MAEVSAKNTSYFRRGINFNRSYFYAVLAVDDKKKEGNPAWVKVSSSVQLSQPWNLFLVTTN